MKIMFMCTGNVQRSVMAQAMFQNMIKGTKYEGVIMSQSSGIAPTIGKTPNDYTIEAMKEIGLDISDHKARKLSEKEVNIWDGYFVMSDTHAYILNKGGIPTDKIYKTSNSVPQPSNESIEEYRKCRQLIQNELYIFYHKLTRYVDRLQEVENEDMRNA